MEIFFGWFVLAVIAALAAVARGRSGAAWFLVSVVLSPFVGLILVLVLPNLRQEKLLRSIAGHSPLPPRAGLGGRSSRVTVERKPQPFTPDGVYAGTPYRVERDGTISAMMSGGLVVFRSEDQFRAAAEGRTLHDEMPDEEIARRYPQESGDLRYRIERDGRVFAWSRDIGEKTFKNWRSFYDATHG